MNHDKVMEPSLRDHQATAEFEGMSVHFCQPPTPAFPSELNQRTPCLNFSLHLLFIVGCFCCTISFPLTQRKVWHAVQLLRFVEVGRKSAGTDSPSQRGQEEVGLQGLPPLRFLVVDLGAQARRLQCRPYRILSIQHLVVLPLRELLCLLERSFAPFESFRRTPGLEMRKCFWRRILHRLPVALPQPLNLFCYCCTPALAIFEFVFFIQPLFWSNGLRCTLTQICSSKKVLRVHMT